MAGISGQDNDDSSATTVQNGSPKSQSVTATVNGNGKRKSTEYFLVKCHADDEGQQNSHFMQEIQLDFVLSFRK